MKKYILGAVLSLSILISPAFTQAASLTDAQVQAILSLLTSFGADSTVIAGVNTALTGTTGGTSSSSSAGFCYNFSRDLGIGLPLNVSDASALDSALLNQGIGGNDFDSFDEEVAARIVQFQAKYRIPQTGYVGHLTRAKLNSLYACPVPATESATQTSSTATRALSVARAESTLNNVIAGTNLVKAGKFTFASRNSSYTIDKLSILVPRNAAGLITSVTLRYPNAHGVLTDATAIPISPDSTQTYAPAIFTGLTMHVAENATADLTVYVSLAPIYADGDSGTAINVTLDTGSTRFHAFDSAGTTARLSVISSDPVGISTGGMFYVRKTLPTFSWIPLDSTSVSAGDNKTIGRFKIAADPAGDISWKKLVLSISKSASVTIGDASTIKLLQGSNQIAGSFTVSANAADMSIVFVPAAEQVIPAGASFTYELHTPIGSTISGASPLTVSIANPSTAATTGTFANVSGGTAVSPSFVWSDRSSINTIHSLTTSDWTNDYLVSNLALTIGRVSVASTITAPAQTYSYSFEKTAALIGKMIVGLVPDDLAYDINKDGKIDLSDQLKYLNTTSIPSALVNGDKAYLVDRMIVGTLPVDLAYDINGDGQISLLDSLAYLKLSQAPSITVTGVSGLNVTVQYANIPTGVYAEINVINQSTGVAITNHDLRQGGTGTATISLDPTQVSSGSYYTVVAYGTKPWPTSSVFQLQGTAPTCSVTVGTASGSPVVTWISTGATSATTDLYYAQSGKYDPVTVSGSQAVTVSAPTIYSFWFTGPGGNATCVSSTITPIATTPAPTITVVSPNGGETYSLESDMKVTWSVTNIPAGGYIVAQLVGEGREVTLGLTYQQTNTDNYYISAKNNIVPGKYKVRISIAGVKDGEGAMDSSDGDITIVARAPTASVTSSLTIPANTPIVFSGTATPVGSSVYLTIGSLSGISLVSSSGTWSVDFSVVRPTGFSAGSYPFTVYAYPNPGTVGAVLTSGTLTVTAPVTTNTYKAYLNGSLTPFITTNGITRTDALSNCMTNHNANPSSSIRCTWGTEEIYSFTPALTTPLQTTATVAPNRNAMSCTNPPRTGLSTSALACYGIWDFGSAFGDDKNMCPGYGTPATGCKVLTIACTSGQAVATRILDTYLPWNTNKSILASATDLQQIATNLQTSVAEVQKDLIRVWEYTCVTAQAASALSGLEDASRPVATSPSISTDILTYTWDNNLQVGSPYFADVTALQRALMRAGVYGGEVTGGFYGQTYSAVKAFQRKYGIDATGFVGPVTRTKLNELY